MDDVVSHVQNEELDRLDQRGSSAGGTKIEDRSEKKDQVLERKI